MRSIPDFTNSDWHRARNDDRLIRSVNEGKGLMPAMKSKIGKREVVELVSLVRKFGEGPLVLPDDSEKEANQETSPEPENIDLLRAPSPSARQPIAAVSAGRLEDKVALATSEPLFRRFCISCHGQDGRGEAMRSRIPGMPDFTSLLWHRKRSDAEITCSVLEGKGTAMPAFRGRIADAQVREVVAYVRSIAPGLTNSKPRSAARFRQEFEQLREQMDQLDRQYRALASQQATASNP